MFSSLLQELERIRKATPALKYCRGEPFKEEHWSALLQVGIPTSHVLDRMVPKYKHNPKEQQPGPQKRYGNQRDYAVKIFMGKSYHEPGYHKTATAIRNNCVVQRTYCRINNLIARTNNSYEFSPRWNVTVAAKYRFRFFFIIQK